MSLVSSIKTMAARAADLYSYQANPWDVFDRPALPKTHRTLKERETECFSDLQSFWFFSELLVHRIPLGEKPPILDMGDQATWQGFYVAMLCLKYSRAKSDSLALQIANGLTGMYQHQWFHGEGKARLIRGYDRAQRNSWQDDASNDTCTGHFVGLYFAIKFGPAEVQGRALQLLAGLTAELIENNYCLIKADKTPTTYGKLINGVLTDPMQMTLALAIMTVASVYKLHPKADAARAEILEKYGEMIPYPKMVLGTWENWNDDHRAAAHLCILRMEDTSVYGQMMTYRGLTRLWKICADRGNVWVNALIALGLGPSMSVFMKTEMRRQALLVLGEFELEDKRNDTEVDYRGNFDGHTWAGFPVKSRRDDGSTTWTPRIITIGTNQRSTEPLPLWISGKQDFVWQRHRYSACDWVYQKDPTQRFNGADYLAAYHASIAAGILKGDE